MPDEEKNINIPEDGKHEKEERAQESERSRDRRVAETGVEPGSQEGAKVISEQGGKSPEKFLRRGFKSVVDGVENQLDLLHEFIEQIGETSEGLSQEDRQRIEEMLEKAQALQEKIYGITEKPGARRHVIEKALIIPVEQIEQVETANHALSQEVLLPIRNGALKVATGEGKNEKEARREMRREELVGQICSSLLQIQDFRKGEKFGASELVASAVLRELRILGGREEESQDIALVMNEIAARFAQLESKGGTEEEITQRAGEILLYTLRGLETDPDWSSQDRKAIFVAFQAMRANLQVEEGRSLVDVEVQKALTGEEELPTFESYKDVARYCAKVFHRIVNMDHPHAERELEKLLDVVTRQTVYRTTFDEKISQLSKKRDSWWRRKKVLQEVEKKGGMLALSEHDRERIIHEADDRWKGLEKDIRLFGGRIGTYHAFEILCRNLPSPSHNISFFAEYERDTARELIYPINRPSQESRQRFFEAPHSLEFVEAIMEKLEEGDMLTTSQVNELSGIIHAFLSNVFLVSHMHPRRLESSIPTSFNDLEALDLIRLGHFSPSEKEGFILSLIDSKERLKYALSTELPLLDQSTSAVIQPKLLSIISRFLQLENQPKEITELQRVCTFLFLSTEQGNFDPRYLANSVVQGKYLTKEFLIAVMEYIPKVSTTDEEVRRNKVNFLSKNIRQMERSKASQDISDLVMRIPPEDRNARLNFELWCANETLSPETFEATLKRKPTPHELEGMDSVLINDFFSYYTHTSSVKRKQRMVDLVLHSLKDLPPETFISVLKFVQKVEVENNLDFHEKTLHWLRMTIPLMEKYFRADTVPISFKECYSMLFNLRDHYQRFAPQFRPLCENLCDSMRALEPKLFLFY